MVGPNHLKKTEKTSIAKVCIFFFVCLVPLIGCSGGGGDGGSVGFSNGQEPDPAVLDVAIAYVKRPLDSDQNDVLLDDDLRTPDTFIPGAELYVRDRASPSSAARNITEGLFAEGELYDIKDLSASYDGRKLLFSLRAPEIEDADDEDQPRWNVWEYDFDTDISRRVIDSSLVNDEGQDVGAQYLPDGSILFSSTRQRASKAILLDEGKPQFSALDENRTNETFVLHKMEADGSNIKQLTFNASHDLDASVLDDGRILFSRWDNMGSNSQVNLYTIDLDGSNLQFLYGNHSHDTGSNGSTIQFMQARQSDNGQLLVAKRPFSAINGGGEIVYIDSENYTEHDYQIGVGTVDALSGQLSASLTDVSDDQGLSLGGRFRSAFPLSDGTERILASWSQCRLLNGTTIVPCTENNIAVPGVVEAQPLFGIWMFDPLTDSQLPVVAPEEGFMFGDVVALQARDFPQDPANSVLDNEWANEDMGVLAIDSVYDFDGLDTAEPSIGELADPAISVASDRPARFLRIVKAVSIPSDEVFDFDNTAFGRSTQQSMREVLGYVPIEPDGSVKVRVPARVAFTLSVLDAAGQRIGERHQNWLQLQAGEQRQCTGCHTSQSESPHGRSDAELASVNPGAPTATIAFPNTQTALFADEAGETMADVYSRINGVRYLSKNIEYIDEWTSDTIVVRDPDFSYLYEDLNTLAPVSAACLAVWATNCRIVINYEAHIQPLWDVSRPANDVLDPVQERQCSACHSPVDGGGNSQIPEAQLDLTSVSSTDEPNHLTSYRELLFDDNEAELTNGVITDRLEQQVDENGNLVFQLDTNGAQILDGSANPIPVLGAVTVAPLMTVQGARASGDFFDVFAVGGSHENWLTPVEQRLLAEWVDLGAQYFNNPFDAPLN